MGPVFLYVAILVGRPIQERQETSDKRETTATKSGKKLGSAMVVANEAGERGAWGQGAAHRVPSDLGSQERPAEEPNEAI